MELRQLRYFVAIAHYQSFSRASARLYIAQPALSRQIKVLELELGHTLFHRVANGVDLTEAGIRLRDQADQILRRIDNLKADLDGAETGVAGTVALGLPPSLALLLGPRLVALAKERHPELRVHIVEGLSVFLLDWLDFGRLDVAVLSDLGADPCIKRQSLVYEEMMLVGVPALLDGLADRTSIAALDGRVLLISKGFRKILTPILMAAHVEPDYAMELDSIPVIREMVDQGLFATLAPVAMFADSLRAGRLRAVRFHDVELGRQMFTAHSARRPVTAAITAVGRLVAELCDLMNPPDLVPRPDT